MENFSKHSKHAWHKSVDFCCQEKSFTGSLGAASSAATGEQQTVDSCLTPSSLRKLTACDDLQKVTFFETRVNTSTTSLGKFGAFLPNLLQLKLNNSIISSVRDLGASLRHLQVLWMACCGLQHLDGLSALYSLKELYLAFNNIADLSQVGFLNMLEILDLEGNCVEDLVQVQHLAFCSCLANFTLEGNPVCLQPPPSACAADGDYSYRKAIHALLPHLRMLDDRPIGDTSTPQHNYDNHDWMLVRNAIVAESRSADVGNTQWDSKTCSQEKACSHPGSAKHPSASKHTGNLSQGPMLNHDMQDLVVCASLSPHSCSGMGAAAEGCSTLTHGSVGVICGNPSRALRARRQERNADLGVVHPEEPFSVPTDCCLDEQVTSFEDAMDELGLWRKHFHKVHGASDEANPSDVFSSTDLITRTVDSGGESEDLDGLTFVLQTKIHDESISEACPSGESSQTTPRSGETILPPEYPLELRPPEGAARSSASLTTRRRRYRIPAPEVSLHAPGTLSLDFSNSTSSLDHSTSTPRSDHSTSTPRSDHSTSTPRSHHSTSTPRSDHSTSTPRSDHTTSTPRSDHTTSTPRSHHSTSTPRSHHSTSTPRSDHSTSTPRSDHTTSTPRSDHSISMPRSDHSTSTP
uniref:leucine-rich repeat-containing protein 56 isoform X1 n=2 Tax=Myxine glutinosa TaxID=7769 RepID=UPI00358EE439